jgi:hypothetical protein
MELRSMNGSNQKDCNKKTRDNYFNASNNHNKNAHISFGIKENKFVC